MWITGSTELPQQKKNEDGTAIMAVSSSFLEE